MASHSILILAGMIKDAMSSGRTRNVMRPFYLIPVLATAILFILPTAHRESNWLSIVLVVLLFILTISFIAAFFYFAVTNPKLLQSETYQLREKSLDYITTKKSLIGAEQLRGLVMLTDSEASAEKTEHLVEPFADSFADREDKVTDSVKVAKEKSKKTMALPEKKIEIIEAEGKVLEPITIGRKPGGNSGDE